MHLRIAAGMGVGLLLLFVTGCHHDFSPERAASGGQQLFAATSMRIHPIFTGPKDWTGDGKPDGIEAELEFQDQFGDPTKAAGTVIFELFAYEKANPDPRGIRLANPWLGSIATVAEQQARWNRTTRTYSFQLAYPKIEPDHDYVLTAIFDPTGGRRFFDRTILQGHRDQERKVVPSPSVPGTGPSTRTSEP
jgi:hypothetical protein